MIETLTEDGAVGFAIQLEKGCFITPDTWLPTMACDEPLALRRGLHVWAARGEYENKHTSGGERADGSLLVPLVPGVLANLLSWIQDRDSHNQGRWASLLVQRAGELLKVRDAKVRRATFRLCPGAPVMCVLDIAGLHAEPGSSCNAVMPCAAPYIYGEAEMELATGGGALEPGALGAVTIAVDNSLDEPLSGRPITLQSWAGVRVRGTIAREFTESAIYADFAAGEEAAMTVQLQRGANVTHMALPRILYTERDVVSISDGGGIFAAVASVPPPRHVEHVTFIGLGSSDGVTPPITLS